MSVFTLWPFIVMDRLSYCCQLKADVLQSDRLQPKEPLLSIPSPDLRTIWDLEIKTAHIGVNQYWKLLDLT